MGTFCTECHLSRPTNMQISVQFLLRSYAKYDFQRADFQEMCRKEFLYLFSRKSSKRSTHR